MAPRRRSSLAPDILLPALLAPILLLTGCPLVSDYPLSDPKASAVDGSLVGDWTIADPEAEEKGTLFFLPFDEHELVAFARGETSGKIEAYRAFTTSVAGERFLNVRELGPGASGWYIINYRIEGGRLVMRTIDDGLFKGASLSSPAELFAFVAKSLGDPALYASGQGEKAYEMTWNRAPERAAQ